MGNIYADLRQGECLQVMAELPDQCVDAIICDPPYGTTACKWDSVIPFAPMWEQLNRLIKPRGAVVLFGSEPFSSALRMSNIKNYKYDWVWDKVSKTNGMNARHQPLRQTELISVFYKKNKYYPIMWEGKMWSRAGKSKIDRTTKYYEQKGEVVLGKNKSDTTGIKYPSNLLRFTNADKTGVVHPTQKPVALMEYLVKTYTNEHDVVLDFTMGSGSTGVACVQNKRFFIGIEQDAKYYDIATNRINNA
jgi:site-specific DNA-methyltransferase (adenine-specific)